MALFGGRKNTLDTILASGWADESERNTLLQELRSSPPKPAIVLPMLWHADAVVRKIGAEIVLAKPDADTTRQLITSYGQRTPQARKVIVAVAARLPSELVKTALDPLLVETQQDLRRPAWELALAMPGTARVGYLRRALLEAPSTLRLQALEELTAGGVSAVESQLELLIPAAAAQDRQLRQKVLEKLASSDSPEILELMLDRLAEGDEEERKIADTYLRRVANANPEGLRETLLEVLTRGSDETRRLAIGILLDSGSPQQIVPQILDLCSRLAGWMRTRIIDVLRESGDRVLEPALALLQHPDRETRTNAIMVLADGFKDPRLVAPFSQLLADDDWWLRVTACQVLGGLEDERAVAPLVQALSDEDTRWAAVDSLAQIGATSALKPLSQLLKDPREEVRLEVLQAFSRFQDQRLLPVLRSVRDRDPADAVRQRAGEVLQEIGRQVGIEEQGAAPSGATPQLQNPLDKLLHRIRVQGASDLHLSVDEPPLVRIDGVLARMEKLGKLSAAHTQRYILGILDDQQRRVLKQEQALDFCHEIPGVGRYRANAYIQRRGLCASFRVIPDRAPTFADLRLPEQLKELLDYHQGVIILSGPSGCGKSTTLTALVDLINTTKPTHVITLEDPIEFVHPPKMALVNQRELGAHTLAFANGLRAALREDPDIIVVGELRDTDTIRMALEAAETGHLVITTLHTTSAVQTIDRLVESFPPDEQSQVRTSLSESLKYIVSQRLLPMKGGRGRVALFEVIKGTLSIANKIRKCETFQIPGLMQIGRHLGMRTRDHALQDLLEEGLISPETAWRHAEKKETFVGLCDPSKIQVPDWSAP